MIDQRGNPVSSASADALDHAETALWRMCSFFDAPLADIESALGADPHWMLPHVMRASFLLTLTEADLVDEARASLARAEALAGPATPRERAHLAAALRGAAGDWPGACDVWETILIEHPRDLYALQWAHLFDFYRGDVASLRHRVARVLPAWSRDDDLYPYLLGMHAFGLEENNLYDEAEAVGRAALGRRGGVPWAIHAVAHVMEMQGRYADGQRWLREREVDWAEGNGFAGHQWWHLALFHLEAMDLDGALALYDAHQGSAHSVLTLQRLDGAALLWRLGLLGVDTVARWEDLANGWDLSPEAAGQSAFNDLHALLVLLGQRRHADAQALIDAAGQRAVGSNAAVARAVGVPLMRALVDFAEGRCAAAVQALRPLRDAAQRVGGSHAQRDLIAQTLLAAAAGAPDGSTERAAGRALLNERRLAKAATPLTENWASRLGVRA